MPLGCGKISNCVIRGFCSLDKTPKKILVSKRSESTSSLLKKDFPDLIDVIDSNEVIAESADIVFLGLVPTPAREILPTIQKQLHQKLIFSILAAVNLQEIIDLTKSSPEYCIKMIPLPSIAKRSGPILFYPKNDIAQSFLNNLGDIVVCNSELDMKPLIALVIQLISI